MHLSRTVSALATVLTGAMSLAAQDQANLAFDATMGIYRAGSHNDGSHTLTQPRV